MTIVNETCSWWRPTDPSQDFHNPILIHVTPSDMTWNEQRTYVRARTQDRQKRMQKGKAEDQQA